MLTQDQIIELKRQLSEQIQNLPLDQKEEAQEQIDNMSAETLEIMLKEQTKRPNQSVLRMIVENKLPSKKIDQNKYAIAVLDIKPLTKGHTLIIPIKKVSVGEQAPSQAFSLAKKVARRIKSKLKPIGIEIQTETKFDEQIINILPYYDKQVNLNHQRYEASEEELIEMQIKLSYKPKLQNKKKESIPEVKKSQSALTLRRRIP